MPIAITAIYAGILALVIVALGINVTVHRVKLQIPLGDAGNPDMLRMVRIHANAIEYVPLALLLMAIYEINGGWHAALHIIGIALIAARIIQTWAMWFTHRPNTGRRIGQSLTWLSLGTLALLNLAKLM